MARNINILHVDDEKHFLDLCKLYLEKINSHIKVENVSSPNQVVQKLEGGKYEVIISDYQMPGKNGLELLAELRKNDNNIPFIILTGRGREEVVIQALNLGADFYIQKSSEPEVLFTELNHFISKVVEKRREEKIRERAELALQESHKLFSLFMMHLPGLAYMKDENGCYFYINKTLENIDLKPEEIYGKTDEEIWSPEIAARLKKNDLYVLTNNQAIETIEQIPLKDMINHWLTAKFPIPDEDGKQTILAGISFNISKQIAIEEKLRESEKRFRNFVADMPFGFAYHEIIMDEKGKPIDFAFLDVNKSFELLTSLKKEDIIGKKVTEVLPGIESGSVDWINTYGRVALSGKKMTFEQYSETLGKWYLVHAQSPKKGYFTATFFDITEYKQMKNSLK
ncbi:MAG: response regulator [Candidatus Hodarchaeales archaeon]